MLIGSVNCWVRLQGTREVKALLEVIASCDSSLHHAQQLPNCVHNSVDSSYQWTFFCFITLTLFEQILVSPNPSLQICISMADYAWLKLHECAGYVRNDRCGSLKKYIRMYIFFILFYWHFSFIYYFVHFQNLVQAKRDLVEERNTLRQGLDKLHFFIESLKR